MVNPGMRPAALAAMSAVVIAATDLSAQESAAPASPDADRRAGDFFDRLRDQTTREEQDRQTATGPYAGYLKVKKDLQDNGVTFALNPTLLPQWGSGGGDAAVQWILAPSLNWDIFNSDRFGQGSLQVGYFWGNYSSETTGETIADDLGMLSPPNSTAIDYDIFSTLTYTQVFPGNKVQVTLGQFGFDSFDTNEYADDEQTNFANNSLSWNASETYSLAGLGGYVQLNPTPSLSVAFGAQNATNLTGETIETDDFGDGPWAWFAYGQWTPKFSGLGSARYSLLYYAQPSVPDQPEDTTGWSFNAVQNLNETWGLFARINASTGAVAEIEQSVAAGVVGNDPFGRNPHDQLGLGLAWNKTNKAAFPDQPTRDSEVAVEGYWNITVGKAIQIGPSVQVVFDPALDPGADTAAVFSLRLSGLF